MIISLKAARVNAGLTQEDVAKAINKSRITIQSYETYRSVPTVITAKKIANLYNLNLDDIDWKEN